jgi:hypothetical protein
VDAGERDVLREMIRHEDDLRDQRLGWLFALTGFLFTAVGLAWSDAHATALVTLVGVVGACVSVSTAASLRASELAIARLRALAGDDEPGRAPVAALRSEDLRHARGLAAIVPHIYPWRVVPWLLAIVWVALPVVSFVR